ncbi:hypothetical protein HanIR_Chr08g0382201 [Helianthus annuus]|nr:hypothetical protein HanIR_Chr08g0382201 [Helianthus annuus]
MHDFAISCHIYLFSSFVFILPIQTLERDRDRVRVREKCDGEGACPLPPTGHSAPACVSNVSTSSLPQVHVATENENLKERKNSWY